MPSQSLPAFALILAALCGCSPPPIASDTAPSRSFAAAGEQDAALREQMEARWSAPVRRPWRIEYREIEGLPGRSSWHVQGSSFWVALHPGEYGLLDKLDRAVVYELDAVALDQHYGVIQFYLYSYAPVLAR